MRRFSGFVQLFLFFRPIFNVHARWQNNVTAAFVIKGLGKLLSNAVKHFDGARFLILQGKLLQPLHDELQRGELSTAFLCSNVLKLVRDSVNDPLAIARELESRG